jgi:hypothetical protein
MLLGNAILDVIVDLEAKCIHIMTLKFGDLKEFDVYYYFPKPRKEMCGRMAHFFLLANSCLRYPSAPATPHTVPSHHTNTPFIRSNCRSPKQ